MVLPLRLAIPLLTLLLASCGGGGGGGNSGGSGGNSGGDGSPVSISLPMATGDRWLYAVTPNPSSSSPGSGGEELVQVTGITTLDGTQVAQVDTLRPASLDLLRRRFLHSTGTQIQEHFPAGAAPYGQTLSPLPQLRMPLVPGESFLAYDWLGQDLGSDLDGDGVSETVDEKLIVTVVGTEAALTLQGSSFTAVKVTSLRTDVLHYSQGSTGRITTRVDEWLANNIGVVRRLVTTTYAPPGGGFSWDEQVSYDLLRYTVGGRRSELQAPQVQDALRTPLAGATTNDGWLQVRVPFSETLDVNALTTHSLVIENSSGEAMPGVLSVTDRELSFRPSAPLPSGTYTVRARNVPDVIGNVLVNQSWTFTVDTGIATDPQQLVPLAVGNRWIYDVTTRENNGNLQYSQRMETVTGTALVQGRSGFVVQTRNTATFALEKEAYFEKGPSTLTQLFAPGTAPFGLTVSAVPLLHFPMYGETYQNGHWTGLDTGRDYDGDGVNETAELTVTTTVGSIPEYKWTSVGTWPTTTRVMTVISQLITSSATGGQVLIKQSTTEWLAPGIGTIKRERGVSAPGYSLSVWEELSGYRVGTQRAYLGGAWPSSRSPMGNLKVPPTEVVVNFDKPLDLGAMATPLLAVTNSSGQSVPGSLQATPYQLRFVPDNTFPDDRYHVALADPVDLVGRPVSDQSWDFTLDTVRPQVLSASLANGVLVTTNPAISFTMSEPVTFNSSQITLRTAAGTDASYSASMVGNTLTISSRLLAHDTTYTLTLTTSVRDAAGNTLASPTSVTFMTPPALLQTPATAVHTRYSTISASTIAIGDVNDDGRNDLVMATGMSTVLSEIDSFTLHVFLQNSDGTLAAPLKTKTFNFAGAGLTCLPSGLGIGDITGDGRTDIVLGEAYCGIKIIEQQEDGSWALPATPISATNTLRIQYLDMNGDGLKDVVGFNASNGNLMSIWYRQAAGGLGAETTLEVAATNGGVLHLNDMNGDGRTDIVVAKSLPPNEAMFGIMTQKADGSFNAPAFTSGDNGTVYWQTKVADLNNDGLADIAGQVRSNTPGMGIAVLYQQADGTLQPPAYYPADMYTDTLFLADFDNDGRNDAISSSSGTLGLFLQGNNGLLKAEDRYGGSSILAVGDLSGDGKPDVLTGYGRTLYLHRNIAP